MTPRSWLTGETHLIPLNLRVSSKGLDLKPVMQGQRSTGPSFHPQKISEYASEQPGILRTFQEVLNPLGNQSLQFYSERKHLSEPEASVSVAPGTLGLWNIGSAFDLKTQVAGHHSGVAASVGEAQECEFQRTPQVMTPWQDCIRFRCQGNRTMQDPLVEKFQDGDTHPYQ